ncbi:DUF3298 and DUF4163 domain-containing protein [Tumebacillus avium]|uniref:DUF3298 and DUF4163 domain-containing protein n=1 Tax=Tumebacillus avium TaxID=1903704 RepID=UPI0018DFD171|nr:DUF3298 and DUF4163 domain-containing protein [Tumebacillus avium]
MNSWKSRLLLFAVSFMLLGGTALAELDVQIINKQYTEQKPEIKISYPELSGLPDLAVQAKLNELFRQEAQYQPQPDSRPLVTYINEYKVTLREKAFLNVLYDNYEFTGGAHGMQHRKSLLVNLKDGTRYALKDLFLPGADYVTAISDIIKEQDAKNVLDTFQPFEKIDLDEGFYLTPEHLVIYFPPIKYTPYYMGFQEFKIPYAKLNDILKPEWRRT